jgi:hypothetical protein
MQQETLILLRLYREIPVLRVDRKNNRIVLFVQKFVNTVGLEKILSMYRKSYTFAGSKN